MRIATLPFLLGLTLAIPLAAQAEDLMDVLQQALANDPELFTADAQRRVSDQDVPIARAALLPQASLNHELSQTPDGTRSDGEQGQQRTRELTGSLTQTVFDLSTVATLKQAKASAAAGQESYRAELLDLYVRSAQAYFNVLLRQDQLATYNAYEDAYRRSYEQTNTLYAEGLSAQVDKNQAQAYYLLVKSQRISAENSLQQVQQALTQITGRKPAELRRLREDFPMQLPQPSDPESWVVQALQSNPALQAEGYSLRAAEHAIRAARAGHLPTLQASYGYSKSGSWYRHSPSDPSNGPAERVVGLSLNFPLFSGGAVRAQVRQAVAERDMASGTLESERRQVEYDVRSNYQQLVQGVAQVEAARQAVQASRESLKSMQVGYEIGTQSLTNLVVAIGNLADSQNEYTSVRHDYVMSLLLLKRAAGVLTVQDLQEVNRWLQ